MTKYILSITTFRLGMPLWFEFETKEAREMFSTMFINNLRYGRKDGEDYVIHIGLGERTYASFKTGR